MLLKATSAVALVFLSSCSGAADRLFGVYDIQPKGGAATLELMSPDKYEFCEAGKCSSGKFKAYADNGRIMFEGYELERYTTQLLASAMGGEENVPAWIREPNGVCEMGVSFGLADVRLNAEALSGIDFVQR